MTHCNEEMVYEEQRDGFTIRLYVMPEDHAPDWDFQDVEEENNLLERIDNGSMLWFQAHVEASKNGIALGHDYLGGCCYETIAEFIGEGQS